MVAEHIYIDSRIDCSGCRGTVKYVGEVLNTEGIWIGVDWDDPQRGKHNGTYKGIQYFQASYPTSGSFVRPAKVNVGISIVEAIKKRYGLEGSNAGIDLETVSKLKQEIRATLFEVVGAIKLNKKQSDFLNLRVVFLRDMLVNGAGLPLALFRTCPNIEELDLSRTLIGSWETVAEITQQLKSLRVLNLNENRIKLSGGVDSESFASLRHIVLGSLNYNWSQVLKCAEFLLNIQALQVHFNKIDVLEAPSPKIFTNLSFLDMEGNPIRSWDEINKLGHIETLTSLNVNNCGLKEVHFPLSEVEPEHTCLFRNLNSLKLVENRINDWKSISELDKLKSLTDLKFKGNPVLDKENFQTNHQLILARIKNLQVLNGEYVMPEERKGAEIDYLKRFGVEWLKLSSEKDKQEFSRSHPCYERLVAKYGAPDENELRQPPTSLKSQLIQIDIVSSDKAFSKKVPYNMSIQKLSGLIQRLFNTGYTIPNLACVHMQRAGALEIPLDDSLKDLNYYSVENGDKIRVSW